MIRMKRMNERPIKCLLIAPAPTNLWRKQDLNLIWKDIIYTLSPQNFKLSHTKTVSCELPLGRFRQELIKNTHHQQEAAWTTRREWRRKITHSCRCMIGCIGKQSGGTFVSPIGRTSTQLLHISTIFFFSPNLISQNQH